MCRVLYGVSGEGAGHSSRAREMVPHLLSQGHDVRLVSYDRGYRVLAPLFGCLSITGLHIVSVNNRVRRGRTLFANLRRAGALLRSIRRVRDEIRHFRPDVVITDFEPVTAWLARLSGIPLISLDNQHRMRYMHFDTPPGMLMERRLTRWVIRCMVPSPDAALATTYFYGPVNNGRTFLFPPILRQAITRYRPQEGRKHLVYITNHYGGLIRTLRDMTDQQFVIYGCERESIEGNLHFRCFSDAGFLQDLAMARSVMGTAGFTLISEALYLGKPYLAFPMRGQFEQQLNALFLEQQGFGMNASGNDEALIREFLSRLPEYHHALARYAFRRVRSDNGEIRSCLDRLLADDCRALHRLREQRLRHRHQRKGTSAVAD